MREHQPREQQLFEDVIEGEDKSGPYLRRVIIRRMELLSYNPEFGDERACTCNHSYHRHFDSYENMSPVGCKYCDCGLFKLV